MGKYFGREPRYSREEIERQAQQAIDARVSLGRPPVEEWRPLEDRLDEIDRVLASRPLVEPIPAPQPPMPPAARPRAGRRPLASRSSAD